MSTPLPAHRAAALGFFRSSVFFVMAMVAFSQHDEKTSTILVSIVFLLDVASWHLSQVMFIATTQASNFQWHSTLADRFILQELLERVRMGSHIDFDEIVKAGTKDATADITQFLKDQTIWQEWGGFRRFMLGLGHFLWYWLSYGMFYGTAGFLVGSKSITGAA